MKKVGIHGIFFLMLFMGLVSCEETPPYEELTDSRENARLFIAKAATGIYDLPPIYNYLTEELAEPNSVTFNVGFGAVGLPANDIPIDLSQDTDYLDSININREMLGQELYESFPEDAFELDKSSLTIPAGEEYSDLATLTYYPEELEIDKNYLLAVSTDNASGYDVSPNAGSIVFELEKATMPELEPIYYDRTNWEIADFSSQSGAVATNFLDGDTSTAWHSCWGTCDGGVVPGYPHHITVDMKEVKEVDGIDLIRTGNRRPRDIEILVSNDYEEWRTLGEFPFQNHGEVQTFMFDETEEFRYFRIILIASHDGDIFGSLDEGSAFKMDYVF